MLDLSMFRLFLAVNWPISLSLSGCLWVVWLRRYGRACVVSRKMFQVCTAS